MTESGESCHYVSNPHSSTTPHNIQQCNAYRRGGDENQKRSTHTDEFIKLRPWTAKHSRNSNDCDVVCHAKKNTTIKKDEPDLTSPHPKYQCENQALNTPERSHCGVFLTWSRTNNKQLVQRGFLVDSKQQPSAHTCRQIET